LSTFWKMNGQNKLLSGGTMKIKSTEVLKLENKAEKLKKQISKLEKENQSLKDQRGPTKITWEDSKVVSELQSKIKDLEQENIILNRKLQN